MQKIKIRKKIRSNRYIKKIIEREGLLLLGVLFIVVLLLSYDPPDEKNYPPVHLMHLPAYIIGGSYLIYVTIKYVVLNLLRRFAR